MKRRKTVQRQYVLDAVNALSFHPTADEVYRYIIRTYPEISLGTVYRNLSILAESGDIMRIPVPDSADRFDRNPSRHYHIRCTRCGVFRDVDMDYTIKIDNQIKKATGYIAQNYDILFRGICPECQKHIDDIV